MRKGLWMRSGLQPTAGTSCHNHHLSLDIEELASVQSFHRVEVLHCIILCHRQKSRFYELCAPWPK